MENKENINQTSNYTLLHEQLMKAVSSKDEKMISLIFSLLDSELKKERDITSVRTEREKIMWDDPITHFRKVEREEKFDLEREYEHRLHLFQLACSIQYKPQMSYQFANMMKNLADIRQRNSIRFERDKNMWDDPITHLKQVEEEERLDKQNELNDLMKLYVIAKSAGFNEGQELILDKLGDTDLVKEMPNASVGPRKSV